MCENEHLEVVAGVRTPGALLFANLAISQIRICSGSAALAFRHDAGKH